MIIRKAISDDYDAVWSIFQTVISTEDTYVYPAGTPKEQLNTYWFASNMHTFVAEENGEVVGTYILRPNQQGLGDHICNASYMVAPEARGRGIGHQLCIHSMEQARKAGFVSMQFNVVVATNHSAVQLWKNNGFQIIGTTPQGFRHAKEGYVDTYIMYRTL